MKYGTIELDETVGCSFHLKVLLDFADRYELVRLAVEYATPTTQCVRLCLQVNLTHSRNTATY